MKRRYVVDVVIAPVPFKASNAEGVTVIGVKQAEVQGLQIRAENDVHVVRYAADAESEFDAERAAVEEVERFLQVLLLSCVFYQVLNAQIVEVGPKPSAVTPTATTAGEVQATVVRLTPSVRDVHVVGNLSLQERALQRKERWTARIVRALELNYYAHLTPDVETGYLLLFVALDAVAPPGATGNVLRDNLKDSQHKVLREVLDSLLALVGLREELAVRVADRAFDTQATRRPDQIHAYLNRWGIAALDVNAVWRIRGALAHGPLPEDLRLQFEATLPQLRAAVLEALKSELEALP